MSLRIVVLGLIVMCFGCVESSHGQLFQRLRRNLQQQQQAQQRSQLPPIQSQPRFDSQTYRYTQPRPPVTFVPSSPQARNQTAQVPTQRAPQPQRRGAPTTDNGESNYTAYRLPDGRIVYVPNSQQRPGAQQQRQQQQQSLAQARQPQQTNTQQARQRVRVVTYYDPNTGRYFQRQYLLDPADPAATVAATQPPAAATAQANQTQSAATGKTEDDMALLPPPVDTKVGQASFDSAKDPNEPAKAASIPADTTEQFSVLELEPETKSTPTPGSLPTTLEPTESVPAIEPETDDDSDLFELDLPALNGPGEGG